MQHVFGYTVGHDVNARNWLKKNMGQVVLAACMDTFCPLGPAIVTTDDLSGNNNNIELIKRIPSQDPNRKKTNNKMPQYIVRKNNRVICWTSELWERSWIVEECWHFWHEMEDGSRVQELRKEIFRRRWQYWSSLCCKTMEALDLRERVGILVPGYSVIWMPTA